MGIYYNKYRPFLEVKRSVNGQEEDLDEEQDEAGDDEHADDDTEATDYTEDLAGDDEESEEGEDDEEDEHADDDTEATDYTEDLAGDDEESEDEEAGDDEESEEGGDDEESEDEEGLSEDEIKQMEEELFKSLSPEQMSIKTIELKKQYLDVYNTITNTLTRANKISKDSNSIKTLEFVVNKLLELKELVKFYMTNTFDTKSFIENNINYQQYLATLNTVNKIFKEIKDKKDDK